MIGPLGLWGFRLLYPQPGGLGYLNKWTFGPKEFPTRWAAAIVFGFLS